MSDLRKAAEMALESLKWATDFMTEQKRLEAWQTMDTLEQALAQPEQKYDYRIKYDRLCYKCLSNFCPGNCKEPEQGNSIPNYPITEPNTPFVDTVNISQERVDETAKREHEPWPSVQCVCGGTIYFKYTPRPKREWVGLTDDEIYDYADKFLYQHGSNYAIKSFGKAIEAKLKEKNA